MSTEKYWAVVLFILSILVALTVGHGVGFKKGQVGALSGSNIQYELKQTRNGETLWTIKIRNYETK